MPTAAVASTAVEPATTAAVESITAVIAAADEAAGIASPVAVVRVSVIPAVSVVPTASVVAATTVKASAIVAAVEPGAGADEDAADEVIRAVEAVWSAGVRIVAVVTVGAGWRWTDGTVHGTYSNPHANLSVGITRGKKQNSQQCNIF